MKKILLLFVCFFPLAILAQNKTILVKYKVIKAKTNHMETLFATNLQAVYQTTSSPSRKEGQKKDAYDPKTNTYQTSISLSGPSILDYYLDRESNTVYFTQKNEEKTYLIKDDLPQIQWNLNHTQTKKINQFVCKKATTNFRGSKIVAWYAPEIPIPFGPWKFKGLPGLILEVSAPNARFPYEWSASKIIYPYDSSVDFQHPENLSIIPYKKIINERDEKMKKLMRVRQSRMPEGVKIVQSKMTRAGVEKVFEWEKNESTTE